MIRRWPSSRVALTLLGMGVAMTLMAPIAVLLVDAHTSGWREIRAVLLRDRSYALLGNTVLLTVLVTVGAAIIGTGAAWWLERGALPLSRLWTALLILPMAMPDFVVGYAWHSLWPRMLPLLAAAAIMTLSSYPLVFLPVAAALRRADPALEDVARSLGQGPIATFRRVTLPSIRGAIGSGAMLSALMVISEYGAFETVRFHTLTTEIVAEFQFDPPAAAALCLPLVLLGLAVIVLRAAIPLRRSAFQVQPRQGRPRQRLPSVAQIVGMCAFTATVAAGVIFPIGVLLYWMWRSTRTTLPAVASLSHATQTTLLYSAGSAAAVVIVALPVAYLMVRYPSRLTRLMQTTTFLTRAIPGVIIALTLDFLAITYLARVYQTPLLLLAAYTMMFFPLGVVCVHATLAAMPPDLGDVARSLGRGPSYVVLTVTLPLISPGLIAGFCLVFVTAAAELTATLLLAPLGTTTLATQFWAFQTDSAYGAAAPYALVIIAIALLPGTAIGLWFDRGQPTPHGALHRVGHTAPARPRTTTRPPPTIATHA